jgi:hypothetical protein
VKRSILVALWIAFTANDVYAQVTPWGNNAASGIVPRQMPSGEQLWTYAIQWPMKFPGKDKPDPEMALTYVVAQAMAQARWCSHGWEITKRYEVLGMLSLEGRCKE